MNQEELKALVGRAALEFVPPGAVIGVGTGSTVNHFIDALSTIRERVGGVVSSSDRSTERLQALGLPILDANAVQSLPVYIDGADEIDPAGCMIKGGGAALTREKIVADLADRFVCIADESKQVAVLGRFPLPVEVLPMARAQVCRHFERLGAQPSVREGVQTDNGNLIVDVRGLHISDPMAMEAEITLWPGVVTVGIFARHRARVALIGTPGGVQRVDYPPR